MSGSTIRLDWTLMLGFDQARSDVEGKVPAIAAKVGEKNNLPQSLSLGRNLDAKVGHKDFVERISTAIGAKVGFKT